MNVRGRDGCKEQRYADPVVEPALDVQSLADPAGNAGLGDHGLAERGVGRRQDDPNDGGFPEGQLAEDHPRRQRAQGDRKRQADPEQAYRNRNLAPQRPKVDTRGVGEQDEGQRGLGRARAVELVLSMSIPSRTLGPTRSPIETNRIAGVIGDPDIGFETVATTISASATIVSDHSISSQANHP